MSLFSYVLDHDYGFAPNPFHGVCTLATCKPAIRERAQVGDFVVGTGCAKRRRRGKLVYFMRVEGITTYEEYWEDARFRKKRPSPCGSRMMAFGDNIYSRDVKGHWVQSNSFHSLPTGESNPLNLHHDTHSNKVLFGHEFTYWGGDGPQIPDMFRDYGGDDICAGRGYRRHFVEGLADEFVVWIKSLNATGQVGRPADWARLPTPR